MSDLMDAEVQKKLAISSFFSSAGWILYSELLSGLVESTKYKVESYMNGAITPEKAQEFNFYLGQKRALEGVLAIKDELLEELEAKENSPSEA